MTTPEGAPAGHEEKGTKTLMKVLLPVAIILLLVVGGLLIVKSQLGAPPHPGADNGAAGDAHVEVQVGATLPDFSVSKWGGGTLKASELKTKVTLVNFWATWCEACMVEMPSIVQLRESFKSKGFDVIAVNVDDNPDAVLPKTLKQLGIGFQVYTDPDSKLADLFDVHAIPLTVIMDANRKILFIENGERNWNDNEMRSQLEKWLSG